MHFHTHEIEIRSAEKHSDTKSKFLITLVTIAILSTIVTYEALILCTLFSFLIVIFYFRPKYSNVLIKLLIPLPLIFSLTIISYISRPETFVFSNGLFSANFTNISFSIYQTVRSLVIVILALSFIEGENSFYEVIYALDELPFIPKMFNSLLFLMYRFIFTTQEELRRIIEARYNRHYETPGRFSWTHLKVTGFIIAGLIARSLRKSEIVADNLNSRGFQKRFPHEPKKWTVTGAFMLTVTAVLSLAVLIYLS